MMNVVFSPPWIDGPPSGRQIVEDSVEEAGACRHYGSFQSAGR